ncbi:MAG: zf-HC2 domain-containing protein [candidate division KSB1 bacterium]|nr:zf-HC2 domain-containing protein [candidate division KSB1 bacterium]MDZ7301736.1 zf-HC2 domain-containing protein [candidate division KSB1 bacterium]MDZ7311485.1 zf-HC2 domain-containing protein [candidate division KSB1 bacterium]
MSKICKKIQDKIAGYIDQEIEPSQAGKISRHLEDCPGCAQEVSAQKTVKALVHQYGRHVPASAHLRAAIRHRLENSLIRLGFLNQLRDLFQLNPLPAIASVLGLILFSGLATHYAFQAGLNRVSSDLQYVEGRIEGEIVCIDCLLLELTHAQFTHEATHRIGLRCKDGKVWCILLSEKSRDLFQDPGMLHRYVQLEGHLFQRTHYIEVKKFSFI